jgi:hypothetical protein
VEGEAEQHADDKYNRLLSLSGDDHTDPESLAEAAHERGLRFYESLSDLKQQVILGALAGLYHQWEKELREFIERELMHDLTPDAAAKYAWVGHIGAVFDLSTEFGWPVRNDPFFPMIDACRLVVNVYKHRQRPISSGAEAEISRYIRDPLGPPDCRASCPSISITAC